MCNSSLIYSSPCNALDEIAVIWIIEGVIENLVEKHDRKKTYDKIHVCSVIVVIILSLFVFPIEFMHTLQCVF